MQSTKTTLQEAPGIRAGVLRINVRLVHATAGDEVAGSGMRHVSEYYAVLFELAGATHGQRYKTLQEACDRYVYLVGQPGCPCPDCFSGKIVSVAGPGCSLPAHEFTEVNGTRCWNCGAPSVSDIDSAELHENTLRAAGRCIDCEEALTQGECRSAKCFAYVAPAKLSVDEARAVRKFIEYLPNDDDAVPYAVLADMCPHPSYSHGGSMGNVCDVCGAMEDHD